MPFEERKACALDAVRSRIEQFHSALTVTSDQVRGLLAGSGNTEDDQSEPWVICQGQNGHGSLCVLCSQSPAY